MFSFEPSASPEETPTEAPSHTPIETPIPSPTVPIQTPEPTPTPFPELPINEGLAFELPLIGATGFALRDMYLQDTASENAVGNNAISAGDAFRIVNTHDNHWWYVERNGYTGWVDNRFCMVNLPDIIPSIVFINSNSSHSVFTSSGYDIPGITNYPLYYARDFNGRLGRYEYIMPIAYRTAPLVYAAQRDALERGYTLVVYETFRPLDVQADVRNALYAYMRTNQAVRQGVNRDGWSLSRFITSVIIGHQKGTAIDLTIAQIDRFETHIIGNYSYLHITEFTEKEMPTQIHDLSADSIVLNRHLRWNRVQWASEPFAETMTYGAILLHEIMVGAGFGALASEWWHFDDYPTRNSLSNQSIDGRFYLTETVSTPPN